MAGIPVQDELTPMGNYYLIRAKNVDVEGVRLDKVINQVKSSIEAIKTDFYTKAESDSRYASKTDVYTKSEVDTALNGKVSAQSGYGLISDADKAQIQTNKTGIAAAETAIAGKASQEEVNTIKSDVAGKASAEAVTQLQTDMAVQEARMDQLVGTVPEGSADEIADARVTADGKTESNLGNAIRSQFSWLKETMDTTNNRISNIIAQSGTSDTEVVDARHSNVSDKTYNTLVDRLDAMENYVTPEMFGAVGDGVTDDYDAFFDMLHYVNSSKIKTVFIPKGKYVISDTVFIPEGVTLCGCGEESEIYYNGDYGYYGPGLSNGGSNVTIKNLKINHLETAEVIVKRSMLGGIGFGTAMFEDWTEKHQEKRMRSHAVKNLVAYNLFSDNNYILQTETGIDNIENVTYEKIYAPISKVAFMSTNGARIDNVVVRDVNASLVGALGVLGDTALYENVRCNNLHLGGFERSMVSNCEIDTDKNYNLEDGFYSESLFFGSPETHMINVKFKGKNSKYTTYMLLGASTVYMENVSCESNTYQYSIRDHNPTDGYLYCSNCDFDGTYVGVLHGACVNCKGNFPINIETFINNSNDTRKIYRSEWISDESAWNSNVTAPIYLPAGKYVLCVHLPRITYAKSSEGEDIDLLVDFRNVEQNFNPPRIARNLGEIVSVIELSTSQWVAPRALGTGATFSETEKGGFTALKIQ